MNSYQLTASRGFLAIAGLPCHTYYFKTASTGWTEHRPATTTAAAATTATTTTTTKLNKYYY